MGLRSCLNFKVDHPRGCGEHSQTVSSKGCRVGSSPRMRGAPGHDHRSRAIARIIPADAGSTGTAMDQLGSHADHPRGCGEHELDTNLATNNLGSSPRMRGAQSTLSGLSVL